MQEAYKKWEELRKRSKEDFKLSPKWLKLPNTKWLIW